MDEIKGNQNKIFGGMSGMGTSKMMGAVSKIGKGTMTGTKKMSKMMGKAVSTVAHAATSHSTQEGNSDDEVDDELRDTLVMELFRSLQLQGGSPHSQLVVAVAKGKLATDWTDGVCHEKLVNINWFRVGKSGCDPDESFVPLSGATGSTYQASVDDIGAKISAQCFDLRNPAVCRFAEIGPLTPDGTLVAAVDGILQEELYRLPVVELKVAPKWTPKKVEHATNDKEEESLKKKEGEEEEEDRETGSFGEPAVVVEEKFVEEKEPSKLTTHEVSIELTPRGLKMSACESDTPRGLHFLLKEHTPSDSSLLDGYEESVDVASDIPCPTIVVHTEDPLRVDMIFSLDPSKGKYGGLEWFGDNGGELWGYMDLKRGDVNSFSEHSSRDLLSVTLQLFLPDPHARDVFTVAVRSFTSSKGDGSWKVPWTQHVKGGSEEVGVVVSKEEEASDYSAELKLTIDHLKGDLTRANAETSQAQQEVEAVKAQLTAAHNAALQSSKQLRLMEGEVDTMKKKAGEASKKASNKLKEMKETLSKSEAAQQKAIERANEAEKMAAGIEESLHERVKEAEEKAACMKSELSEKSQECEKLKTEVSHWRRKAESLKKECERGRKTEEVAATLSIKLEEEQEKNLELTTAIEVARQEGAAYKQAMEHALTVTELPPPKGTTLGTMFRRKSDAEVPRPKAHN